jgi:release factor glutamine methyltransferase
VAKTISEALTKARVLLAEQNIDSAFIDADLLLTHALNIRRIDLIIHRDRRLTDEEMDAFSDLIERRISHEPVAYITGVKEFFGIPFMVNPHVLIPRPETEILVELSITLAPKGATVFEIGVGCGAVIISILCERQDLNGVGNDISIPALITTRVNAKTHGVSDRLRLFAGNVMEGIGGSWPMIIANPPYIRLDEVNSLDDDVRLYEPAKALFGGKDGLDIVKEIIKGLSGHLTQGGMLIMEAGRGQKKAIDSLVGSQKTLTIRSWIHDLAGIERVVIIERIHG